LNTFKDSNKIMEKIDSEKSLYINKCKAFISFMVSQQQWSGLSMASIDLWLKNFKKLSIDEQGLVFKLLTNIIYFSENDMLDALKLGVYKCLSYKDILEKQLSSCFTTSIHTLNSMHKANINKSCFVPLLDKDAPHESGNNICRTLVQQGIIPSNHSIFIEQVPQLLKSLPITNLVIVDDCVGSGDQFKAFWKETQISDEENVLTITELCNKYNIKANYLTLFGYDKGIEELRKNYTNLNIVCVQNLTENHRVFSNISYIWEDEEERKKAILLFSSIAKSAGISFYGYNYLDFAFIMHKTIPDWSLPLFWQENDDWRLLLRRKNSDD